MQKEYAKIVEVVEGLKMQEERAGIVEEVVENL